MWCLEYLDERASSNDIREALSANLDCLLALDQLSNEESLIRILEQIYNYWKPYIKNLLYGNNTHIVESTLIRELRPDSIVLEIIFE